MLLKANHLVDLQDARYCAAAGISHISFALDRESWHHLPLARVQEMVGWLSGPRVVLDFGADAEALAAFLERYEMPDALLQCASPAAEAVLPHAQQTLLRLTLTEDIPPDAPATSSLLSQAPWQALELGWEGTALPQATLRSWASYLSARGPWWLDIDSPGLPAIAALPHWLGSLPTGLSGRKAWEQSLHELDFDKIEIILSEIRHLAP